MSRKAVPLAAGVAFASALAHAAEVYTVDATHSDRLVAGDGDGTMKGIGTLGRQDEDFSFYEQLEE